MPSEVDEKGTVIFVELNDGNIVGVLSDLGDLIFEVEVGQLGHVAGLEVVDGFSDCQSDKNQHHSQDH